MRPYATGFNPLPFIPLSLGEACSTEQVLLTLMGEDYATGFNPLPIILLSLGETCSTEQVLLTLMGED